MLSTQHEHVHVHVHVVYTCNIWMYNVAVHVYMYKTNECTHKGRVGPTEQSRMAFSAGL